MNVHSTIMRRPTEQRCDWPSLRPCVPDLLQMLRQDDKHSTTVAARLLLDMSCADRDGVVDQLTMPNSLSVLTEAFNPGCWSSTTGATVAAAVVAVFVNLSCTRIGCCAMLGAPQLVAQLIWLLCCEFQYVDDRRNAANCVTNLLQLETDATLQALASLPDCRGRLAACRRGPVKQQVQKILKLL